MSLRILSALLFMLFALKAPSVGTDIMGYKYIYESTGDFLFSDFEYNYMEYGYKLLMKICYALGCSFQQFTWIIYAIVVYSLYILIKGYSNDICLSFLSYYSLTLFVFQCSGLRQTLAMALCIIAFVQLKEMKKSNILFFFIIVVAATTMHKTALLFLIVFFVKKYPKSLLLYLGIAFLLFFSALNKNYFIEYNQTYEMSKYTYQENLTLGGMFYFYVVITFLSFVVYWNDISFEKNKYLSILMIYSIGLVFMFIFSGSMLMRLSSYYTFFIVILIPYISNYFSQKGLKIIKPIVIIFLFSMFYIFVLDSNTLDIVPYKFYFSND